MYWTESLGRIELKITKNQAAIGNHPGPCDEDIKQLRNIPAIKRQLSHLNPDIVRESLKEYGAWDETELSDHEANLNRLLWIACGDIVEEQYSKRK